MLYGVCCGGVKKEVREGEPGATEANHSSHHRPGDGRPHQLLDEELENQEPFQVLDVRPQHLQTPG
jgi:hypothetical protein